MSDDIEKFEREHRELLQRSNPKDQAEVKKLRPDQRHKERCRALAEYQWSKNAETTIAEMIQFEPIIKIGCEGKPYKPETLHGWINDLCPNRRPGRRPKD